MINRHIHLRLRSLIITSGNHCIGLPPCVNDDTDVKAVNRKFPIGSWVLRYYPPAAQHKLGSPWTDLIKLFDRQPVIRLALQKGPEKPIVFVHVDDLKLCPAPLDISWNPVISTSKSLCASTVAFRPGSHISDITSTPSVGVSDWDDMNTHLSGPAF